jgi:hypothetical protein
MCPLLEQERIGHQIGLAALLNVDESRDRSTVEASIGRK